MAKEDTLNTQASLSTMWLRHRFDNLKDFFAAGRAMGFQRFELSAVVTPAMLDGFRPGEAVITSLHYPCPRVPFLSPSDDAYLSSSDEARRLKAVEKAWRTIDTAVLVGAKAVVLHLGQVEEARQAQERLRELFRQGRKGTPEYQEALRQFIAIRRITGTPHFQAARRSLEEIAAYAAKKGIVLGLETRYYPHEIPDFREMESLLRDFDPHVVGYWHDTGHAQAQENLGLTPHEEWLKAFSPRMVGIHLHDIVGLQDHRPPGMGEMDFEMIAHYLSEGVIRTCEISSSFSPEEVMAGVAFLHRKGCL